MKWLPAIAPVMSLAFLLVMIEAEGLCQVDVPTNDDCISCHGHSDIRSRQGKNRFIDPVRFARSIHARKGIGCISCHEGIVSVSREAKIPHRIGLKPRCAECHETANREYSQSIHAQVSEKICYSCHNPHYSVSFRQMSGDDRKNICLQCHDATRTHKWLPQKRLHFNYLECTSCHALNAQIGLVFFISDKDNPAKGNVLQYEQVARFVQLGKGGLAETLDGDGNGTLSETELSSFLRTLRQKGIPGAALEVRILVLNPSHNFSSRGEQARECTLCHSEDAKFYSSLVLEIPEKHSGLRTLPVEKGILARPGRKLFVEDFYLLGESKIRKQDLDEVADAARRIGFKWIDLVGCFMVALAGTAVSFHILLMAVTRKFRQRPRYSQLEPLPLAVRAWHWLHGLCIVLLVLTGIHLRLPDSAPIFATFLNAVNLHNLCGAVVIVDYVFWISYHVWRKEFTSRFFISPADFFRNIPEMLHYHWYLIFVGKGLPESCGQFCPFDPVERAFFLTNMLLFVPVQIFSGILLYDVHTTMPLLDALGGLRVVDAAHLLCAYLLISSMIIHVYFHTLKKYRLGVG